MKFDHHGVFKKPNRKSSKGNGGFMIFEPVTLI